MSRQVETIFHEVCGLAAGVLRHKDRAAALRIYDEALHYASEVRNNSRARRGEVRALALSAQVLVDLGRAAEARKRLDDAFARLRELRLYPAGSMDLDSEAGTALRALAVFQAGTGNLPQAIETYRELLDKGLTDKSSVESDLHLSYSLSELYAELAALYRKAGQPGSAASLAARRHELWKRWEQKLPRSSFIQKQAAMASN